MYLCMWVIHRQRMITGYVLHGSTLLLFREGLQGCEGEERVRVGGWGGIVDV